MNNPPCAVCGHVNRVGAVACEACGARLNASGWGADDEPSGQPRFHVTRSITIQKTSSPLSRPCG